MDACISFSHLRKLKAKCSELASLAMAKVDSPLKSGRAVVEHRKKVKNVKSDIDSSIDSVTSKWTSIAGAGSNEYVSSRSERDSIREAPKNIVSPPPLTRSQLAKPNSTAPSKMTPPRPRPSNGKEYTPASAVKIMMEHAPMYRGKLYRSMKRYSQIPVSQRRLRQLVQSKRDDNINPPIGWDLKGREPIATRLEMLEKLKENGPSMAAMASSNQIGTALTAVMQEKSGMQASIPSRTTTYRMRNYMKATLPGTTKVRHKPQTRVDAEESIRCVICYLHTIATTHYVVNTDKGALDDPRLKLASDGSRELYKFSCDMHGGAALRCVLNDMNMSTDDTCVFVCTIRNGKVEEWHLEINGNKNSKNRSSFSTDQNAKTGGFIGGGMSIRLTYTMSSSGKLAPIFAQVLHLSERELPVETCPDGILLVAFPGLCIGSSVDSRHKHPGYVAFVRQGVDESLVFAKYVDKVFLPHVERLRQDLGFDPSTNESIPEDLFVVSWSDGGLPQMKNTSSEATVNQFLKLKIISNKHNAARSGTEQPCDLATLFRSQREILNILLSSEYANERSQMNNRKTYNSMMSDLRDSKGLDLGKKHDIFLRFLVCFPETLTRAARQIGIAEGFVKGGQIDNKAKAFPCLDGIMRTLSRPPTVEDYTLVRDTFSDCFAEQVRHGRLVPSFLSSLRADVPEDRNESLRDTDALSFQRALTINHEDMNKQRRIHLQSIKDQQTKELAETIGRNKTWLDVNDSCMKKLNNLYITKLGEQLTCPGENTNHTPSPIVDNDTSIREEVPQNCTVEMFSKCTSDQLKGFIIAREFSVVPKALPSRIVPKLKPGRIEKALDCKDKKIILSNSSPDITCEPAIEERQVDEIADSDDEDVIIDLSADDRLPSFWLQNISWRRMLCSTIKGVIRMEAEEEVTSEVGESADGVYKIILGRFRSHFVLRNCAEKEDHYAFKWAKRNLARTVATLAFFGHINPRVHEFQTDSNVTLLAFPGNGGIFMDARMEPHKSLVGNYLYFDKQQQHWIRSGKVSAKNLNHGTRDEAHKKNSKNPMKSSMGFYRAYCDETAEVQGCEKKGHFQFLEQYCGLSFERDNCEQLTKVTNAILEWDSHTIQKMNEIPRVSKGQQTMNDVQIDMAAYQFELVSSSCIGVSNNISESPGFETIAHTYKA